MKKRIVIFILLNLVATLCFAEEDFLLKPPKQIRKINIKIKSPKPIMLDFTVDDEESSQVEREPVSADLKHAIYEHSREPASDGTLHLIDEALSPYSIE